MKKVLVTGGTVFVSRYIAEFFSSKGCEVYVLNRNTREQSQGVNLIQADRHHLGETLRDFYFDIIIDTAYSADDVNMLLDAVGGYKDYILISSSAVYPEYSPQPFREDTVLGANKYWGKYGTDKIEAENALLKRNPDAYILRPPYLYGPMNNVYREAFVFDCAKADRKFYLPQNGDMKLQFFHIKDLCKLIEGIISNKPVEHILNVGNPESISVRDWVVKCYACYGKTPEFIYVYDDVEQRNYFSFYNYEYQLDVERQKKIYSETISLDTGLKEAAEWYDEHEAEVNKKPYFQYIDLNFS